MVVFLQIIQNFISYLDEWKSVAEKENYEFITNSSFSGLKVSLKATLEICDYLVENCDFSYLMTARLNQDSLEVYLFFIFFHFFFFQLKNVKKIKFKI